MTDISKCSGLGCPLKEMCWRFRAPEHPLTQSWISPPHLNGECRMFWKMYRGPAESENDG